VVFKVSEHAPTHRISNEQSGIVAMSKACRYSIASVVVLAIVGVFWHLGMPSWPKDVWFSTTIEESKERGVFLCSYDISPREFVYNDKCTLSIKGDPWIERQWHAGTFVNTTVQSYGSEYVTMYIEYCEPCCSDQHGDYGKEWTRPILILDNEELDSKSDGGKGSKGRQYYEILTAWPVKASRTLYVVVPIDVSKRRDDENLDTVGTFELTAKEF